MITEFISFIMSGACVYVNDFDLYSCHIGGLATVKRYDGTVLNSVCVVILSNHLLIQDSAVINQDTCMRGTFDMR